MAYEVKIPAAGESINTATVGQWHKSDGEEVSKGDLLATIETDKVSTELQAEAAGTIKILIAEGDEVAIGTIIAEISEADASQDSAPAPPDPPGDFAGPEPVEEIRSDAQDPAAVDSALEAAASAPFGFTALDDQPEVIAIKVPAAGESIASATIAQWHKRDGEQVREGEALVTLETDKVSAELDAEAEGVIKILSPEGAEVAIGAVIGTLTVGAEAPVSAVSSPFEMSEPPPPPEKTVDPVVEKEGNEQVPVSSPVPAEGGQSEVATEVPRDPATAPLKPDLSMVSDSRSREVPREMTDGRTTRRRLSPLRRKIAKQLVNVQQTAAILTTFNEVDMSAVIALRKTVQESFQTKYGVKLGFMSLFVKAVVHALKEVPALNGRIEGEEVIENHFYDIGIAVGTEKGLLVPVLRDADQKGCPEIEKDILGYADRARDGKIQLEDLQGGVFTISNGGIYGSLLSTPILNPPQSGILGMHSIQERPIALDGKVEVRPMMYLALSYDHRLVDGKEAVTFLIRIKECLESPASLLLEL